MGTRLGFVVVGVPVVVLDVGLVIVGLDKVGLAVIGLIVVGLAVMGGAPVGLALSGKYGSPVPELIVPFATHLKPAQTSPPAVQVGVQSSSVHVSHDSSSLHEASKHGLAHLTRAQSDILSYSLVVSETTGLTYKFLDQKSLSECTASSKSISGLPSGIPGLPTLPSKSTRSSVLS